MKLFSTFLLIPLLLLALPGCEKSAEIQPSGKTVKVGFVGPFTGSDAAKGKEAIKGVRTVMHMQPLLANGDAVELVVENDNNDPELTKQALQKLVKEDEVSAIVLASSTQSALGAGGVADATETPVLALLATHPDVTKEKQFISQLCFDDVFQGSVGALFVADELLIEKAAIFTEADSVYSSFLAEEFARKYVAVGGEVTNITEMNPDRSSYDVLLRDLAERGTGLLYLPLGANYTMDILQTLAEIGWSPEIMGTDGLLASVMSSYPENLDYLEGIYATDFYGTLDSGEKLSRFGKGAAKAYKSLFNGDPPTYTELGAEGYAILYHAINRCRESTDRACINSNLRSTRRFKGLQARISIGSDGKAVRPLFINRIRDNELMSVVKVY